MYLVLIEQAVQPADYVPIIAHHLCLTLSISYLTLGLQPLLDEVPSAPKLEVSTKQIVLPAQVQHILFVNDVPSLPLSLLLGVMYTGQLYLPLVPPQGLKDSSTKPRYMTYPPHLLPPCRLQRPLPGTLCGPCRVFQNWHD